MNAYYDKSGVTIYQGDCREVLATLPDGSVNCCVTSPPYWGLRDYGTATWEGGNSECDHLPPDDAGDSDKPTTGQRFHAGRFSGPSCWKCGARRIDQQLGLESDPGAYIQTMVDVFREVWRVLRDDGTIWVNLGDTYANVGKLGGQSGFRHTADQNGAGAFRRRRGPRSKHTDDTEVDGPNRGIYEGFKAKDLVGIPWRVAFALQADGWTLRSDIIWHKPNPMPESVRDRPTKSHEYLFLLSKSQRYYYDADAIKEPVTGTAHRRSAYKSPDGWDTGPGTHGSFHRNGREKGKRPGVTPKSAEPGSGIKANESWHAATVDLVTERNRRSVWTIATAPYKHAHFATFPPDLIEPCILAGCPEGGVVLDPFVGSGTTAMVAKYNGRRCVGIELNPEYCALIPPRIEQEVLF